MASVGSKMANRGNMDTRVYKVADSKSEVKFVLRGCLEAAIVARWSVGPLPSC